jgi:hypothetical protein
MSGTHTDLDNQENRIRILGTNQWLVSEELIGAVVVQTMGSDVIVRLTTGECVVIKRADLESEDAEVQ